MKPKLILCLALVLSAGLFGCSNTVHRVGVGNSTAIETTKAVTRGPILNMDEALAVARAYVKKHGVDVSKCYIDSARFDFNLHGERGKYWLITWLSDEYANDTPIKGGQIYVRVYMNKSVEVFYGE